MKLLITGGTGFIGTALCEHLREAKHDLTVFSRQTTEQVESVCGVDVTHVSNLDLVPAEDYFDSIINLAGEPIATKRWSETRKQQLLDSRIQTTQALIDYISRAVVKPQCLISGSAVGYYGDQGDNEIDESSAPHEEFSHHLCVQWETCAQQAEAQGVRVCCVRTGLVVGSGGGFLKQMLFPFRLGLGGPMGDGKQWMSWVHLDDIVRLFIWLLECESCEGVYNGTAPNPVTNKMFTTMLASSLHRFAILSVPSVVLRAALGEMSGLLLSGQKVIPKRALEQGFKFEYSDLSDALAQVLTA